MTIAGYLESDAALTDHLAACDVSLNLRWPTAGETSGPWLRALAAGVATVITDLVHLGDVPSLDPRSWRAQSQHQASDLQPPVCVAIDILDEDHSLRLAMRRLAADPELRERLGRAGQVWWQREHSLEAMVGDYERVVSEVLEVRGVPEVPGLPAHLRPDGDAKLRELLAPFDIESPL